jgi:hypothetical protein
MKQEVTKWWVGTFPSWIVVILLGIISFFMVRTMDQYEKRMSIVEEVLPRVVKLETKVETIADNLVEIKQDIRSIKTSVRN